MSNGLVDNQRMNYFKFGKVLSKCKELAHSIKDIHQTSKIVYTRKNYNILTFGSCLSRYTALAFGEMFGSVVLSNVFNNRSDLFLNNFLKKNEDLNLSLDELKRVIEIDEEYEKFFLRQKREFVGIYNPKDCKTHQINLWNCISEKNIDLIIVDNYMDVVARDVFIDLPHYKDIRFFLPKSSTLNQEKLILGRYLSLDNSYKNMNKILSMFRKSFKKSFIVFLYFPHETYFEREFLLKRFVAYEDNFKPQNVDLVIHPCVLSENLKSEERQHFASEYYYSIAGLIFGAIR